MNTANNKNIPIEKKPCRPYVLVIIDGLGIAKDQPDNPVALAQTPNLNRLWSAAYHTTLSASGSDVGLLPGQDGNSEAGHMNIGAGRVVVQDVAKICQSIDEGTFAKNSAFLSAIEHCKRRQSNLHLMGLLSDKHSGHAHPLHLQYLLKLVRQHKLNKVFLHLFMDGRDTPKHAGLGFIRQLEEKLQPEEKIATLMGRVFLDRKKNWQRTDIAYRALVLGEGKIAAKPEKAIRQAYAGSETDEFVSPTIISLSGDKSYGRINDNDSVIFFNLRSDRARQLTKPFVQTDFEKKNSGALPRVKILQNLVFVAMTDFGPDLEGVLTAFPSTDIKGTLPQALSSKKQLYIAEGEKYAHITYFFNGGYDKAVAGEDRIFVSSPDVESYDSTPEMSANKITEIVLSHITQQDYDFYALNYANPDMIGHTGNLGAAVKAVECVDRNLGKLMTNVFKQDGVLFITADHGNVEEIINIDSGEIDTEHSGNPVPFFIASKQELSKKQHLPTGRLADIAPTILAVMGLDKSREMTGKNLLNTSQ